MCAGRPDQGWATSLATTTSTPQPDGWHGSASLRQLRRTLIVVVVVPEGVFAQRLAMVRTVAPASACLYEQGRSSSSQAIVVVVVRRPLGANQWHFPSKRRNPELIDVVFSLVRNQSQTTAQSHYYYDYRCRSVSPLRYYYDDGASE